MTNLVQKYSQKHCKPSVPDLKPGYQVKVHQKIKEGNKERVQIFEGMIIRKNAGHGPSETFTVRKISEGIGVEKVFPVHSPTITKIEVTRAHKIRRAKLGYLRALSGKALRLKEVPLDLRTKEFEQPAPLKAETEAAPAAEALVPEPAAAETPAEPKAEEAVEAPTQEKVPAKEEPAKAEAEPEAATEDPASADEAPAEEETKKEEK